MTTPGTLGFACRWDRSPAGTWSGTPWNLRAALREQVTVEDIAVGPPTAARAVLKAAYSRRVAGEWKSLWRHSPASNLVVERTLRRNAARSSADVVVQIQDLGTTPQPFLLVQDLSYHLLLEKAQGGSIPHFRTLDLRRVEQLRDRQAKVYAQAAHLLPMSRWLARRPGRLGCARGPGHRREPRRERGRRAGHAGPRATYLAHAAAAAGRARLRHQGRRHGGRRLRPPARAARAGHRADRDRTGDGGRCPARSPTAWTSGGPCRPPRWPPRWTPTTCS